MKRTMTFLATAAMAAGMVFGQTAPVHQNGRMAARQRFERALNLNDTQKAQAKSIFQNARQENAPLRAQLKQNRDALQVAVKTNDKARIDQLSAAEGQVIGKMMATRTEAMAKFYQTLTPEQRAKADQMHQNWKMQHQNNWRSHRTQSQTQG